MIIIFFSRIYNIFHSFFQFCPVSSSFVRTKLEEIGFFHFFPGVPEEIGFFRKKPNPDAGWLGGPCYLKVYGLYAVPLALDMFCLGQNKVWSKSNDIQHEC